MATKSQKISLGVLGVAAVAFGLDRFVLSPSAGSAPLAVAIDYAVTSASRAANASASPGPSAGAAAAAAAQATTLAGRLSAMAVARRYQYVATDDAFRASDDWLSQANKNKPAGAADAVANAAAGSSEAVHKTDPSAQFAARHSLSAVMHSKTGGMAIVDGKLYEIGRKIDGFSLVKVGMQDATFDANGATVTLKLPGLIPVARIE